MGRGHWSMAGSSSYDGARSREPRAACHGVRRRSELRLQQQTAKVIGEVWGGSGRVFVWIRAFGVCDDTSFLGPMMRQSIELVNQSNERASNQSLARKM